LISKCIPGVSEVEFYNLLKDPIFVDYFNVFLSLPVRSYLVYVFALL